MAVSKHIVFTLMFISLISFNELVPVSGETNKYVKLPLGQNQTGPEAIAFDCKGEGPYVGISDGRILKWQGHHIGWTTYAVTAPYRSDSCDGVDGIPKEKECGRPLGMRFDMRTCELYVADSSFGLMKVGPEGGVASPIINGNPFLFLNSLDVDFVNNLIYFSETSTKYPHWEAGEAINNGDKSGRLMKYNMKTGEVTVLLTGLSFANGVSLSKNNDFVLVAETTANQTLKYWLTGYIAGSHEVIQLNGRPDNINRDANGDFWIAIQLGKSVKINHLGKILENLEGDEIVNPTDVSEFHNRLWFGFIDHPYIYHT
ncbi:protein STRICTOSIDINE SYNTHASE-LIKE 10-like [Silene latifolia]|uniref:protein STRICTOSIDINE SYNTHASE-LIKE 10-like n=1 Tax=Silene latifolia TaxID=37657 RepID=UPI003D779939